MSDYNAVIIKQIATEGARDISATSRYMQKLQDEGHTAPTDKLGILSGAFNCVSLDRKGQLKEIDHYLKLHGNLKSKQAASHQLISYPAGFIPTRDQIERDVNILTSKYGMEDHLVVWDAHTDTANFHVHLLICRVSLAPDAEGKYPIANDGLVQKLCKEEGRKDRLRTDWAGCRQAAIAGIAEAYGWSLPRNVRMTPDGKPLPRQNPKDRQSDRTRAGERKRGRKSKQRLLSEYAKKVFDSAAIESVAFKKKFWSVANRDFMSVGIEQTLTINEQREIHGAFLTGPDGQLCKFSNIGREYSINNLIKRFGLPSVKDLSQSMKDYIQQPFDYLDEITFEEAKKRLKPLFDEAVKTKGWHVLLNLLSESGMWISRSGGGAVIKFNSGKDSIKLSEVSNKYSMKKLESIMGECPLFQRTIENSSDLKTREAAMVAKAKRNAEILVAIAAIKLKHMETLETVEILKPVKTENEDSKNDRFNYVFTTSGTTDREESRNIDPTPEKPVFTM